MINESKYYLPDLESLLIYDFYKIVDFDTKIALIKKDWTILSNQEEFTELELKLAIKYSYGEFFYRTYLDLEWKYIKYAIDSFYSEENYNKFSPAEEEYFIESIIMNQFEVNELTYLYNKVIDPDLKMLIYNKGLNNNALLILNEINEKSKSKKTLYQTGLYRTCFISDLVELISIDELIELETPGLYVYNEKKLTIAEKRKIIKLDVYNCIEHLGTRLTSNDLIFAIKYLINHQDRNPYIYYYARRFKSKLIYFNIDKKYLKLLK